MARPKPFPKSVPFTQQLLTFIFSRIQISQNHFHNTIPCWEWTGSISYKGYGKITYNKQTYPAHRFIYQLFVEHVPISLDSDHLCRVRHCVNPLHIEPVTPKVNAERGNGVGSQNARKDRCIRGHLFDIITSKGHRRCRTCKRLLNRKYKARIKASKPTPIRSTHCKWGHPFDDVNKRGDLVCKTCKHLEREKNRARYNAKERERQRILQALPESDPRKIAFRASRRKSWQNSNEKRRLQRIANRALS